MRRSVALGLGSLAAACVGAPGDAQRSPEPKPSQAARVAQPAAVPATVGLPTFVYAGQMTQGGWIRGQAPTGAVKARLGDQELTLDSQGRFFAAFDRDSPGSALLSATLRNGRIVESTLTISPRAWNIERVDTPMRPGGATPEEFVRRRQPELARINASRQVATGSEGWRQQFVWPVKARISGRFGSQRIYRGGEAGSYHAGLDLAGGAGTAYVAPADGVVVLAALEPFSLEGHLLIIDHGQGLNSAYLHSSELLVREGDRVRQGQVLGKIGMTGRVTGPHLHWSLMWRGKRLDPLLFVPPL